MQGMSNARDARMFARTNVAKVLVNSAVSKIFDLFVPLLLALGVTLIGFPVVAQTSIYMHHVDVGRTGWNPNETTLTPQNVATSQFAALATTVYLDDQIDAQPLVVANQTIAGVTGARTVVYLATESNTIYAVDGGTAAILASRNFGPPVPLPLGCTNNGPNVGINSTPVISPGLNTLNFVAYTLVGGVPTYTLHSVSLSSLADVVTPVVVSAAQTMKNGATATFNATYQRQRPALLYASGNVYAAFGSFCDFATNLSRGWLLGWNASTLAPLPSNELINALPTSPNQFFLSSIWMSGSGPAADPSGNVYVSTGNSDPAGTTFDPVYNLEESVVSMPASLDGALTSFTPSNYGALDAADNEIGGAGLTLIPTTAANAPPLLAAGAKDGRLFVLDQPSLGGYTPGGPDNALVIIPDTGPCWCAPAYFTGSDGVGRIVTSGGTNLMTWQVLQSGGSTQLVQDGVGQLTGASYQDPGFFTSISSNGTAANSGVIWALGRPIGGYVPLYAFAATSSSGSLPLLTTVPAGQWAGGGNANLVPVVANGRVYVASNKQLVIFGLNPAGPTPLPDLVATQLSYNHNAGVFSSVIKNIGAGPTPSGVTIGVAYLVDGQKVAYGYASGPIAPGASLTVGVNKTYAMPSGPHTMTVFVDDVNRLVESNKANNTLSYAYSYPLPDLRPTQLTYSPTTGLFGTVVLNQGLGAAPPAIIGVAYSVDGVKQSCGWASGPLAVGATLSIGSQCGTYAIPSTGSHTVSVLADDAYRIVLASRTDTTLTAAYSYPLADLVPTQLNYNPTTGLFSSVISNVGQGATPAGVTVGVAYFVDGVKQSCGWATGGVAAGGAANVGGQCHPYTIPAGTHTISVLADDVNRMILASRTDTTLTQSITISGQGATAKVTAQSTVKSAPAEEASPALVLGPPNQITGVLLAINGSALTIRSRNGVKVSVDATEAMRNRRTGVLVIGHPFTSRGAYDASGTLHAMTIVRAKFSSASWPEDN